MLVFMTCANAKLSIIMLVYLFTIERCMTSLVPLADRFLVVSVMCLITLSVCSFMHCPLCLILDLSSDALSGETLLAVCMSNAHSQA